MQLLTRNLDLDSKDMRRIMAITLPAMVELVMAQLFGMVDSMMLGHIANSKLAMAAVGFTTSPINLMIGVLSAFNVGTAAAVAWSLGAGDTKGAQQVVRASLALNFVLGTVATAIGVGFAAPLLRFVGATEDAMPYSMQYMQVICAGMLPAALNMGITSALRGAGQTRLPMLYNLGSNVLDVIGNYVLIYGHLGFEPMGVMGAAVTTTFSRVIALLVALVVLFRVDNKIALRIRDGFRVHFAQVKRILRVGVTTAIEQGIMQVGFILFVRSVGGLNSSEVMAAHTIGMNINGLSWVPAQAFGVAATTLVGQSMGSKEPLKARSFAKVVHRMALCASALVMVLFFFGAHIIAGLYINDVAVAALASGVLRLMVLGMPGIATQQPIGAALRGAGDTLVPLIASLLGIWIFRVFVAPLFIYTLGWGLTGAWLAIVLDQLTRAVVVYIRFASGKWMHKKGLAA